MNEKRARYLQSLLHGNGYHLKIDGDWGKNSQKALDKFSLDNSQPINKHGKISQNVLNILRGSIPKRTIKSTNESANINYRKSTVKGLPRSTSFNEMVKFYGHPDNNMVGNLVRVYPAYKLKYGTASVRSIRVHKRCAHAFEAVFKDILQAFGQDKLEQLELDHYSGTYNKRKIRGGRSWSTHAFGCAIDLHARGNELHKSFEGSLFSKSEYKKFMDIWRKHGFVNLGEAINRDSMHFQWANV